MKPNVNKVNSVTHPFPLKESFYIALVILFSLFIMGCSQTSSNPEYFSFWKEFQDLFGPDKWYKESDINRAEEDRLFESQLAELFRKENLIPSDGAKAFLERFEMAALSEILYQSEIKTKIRISDKDLRKYYDTNPDRFIQKECVDIGHIFIEAPRDASEERQKQAQEKIRAAHDDLLSGVSFEDVAKKYSEAESASTGGRAGRLRRNQAPHTLEQAAFSLQPGQTSPILRTEHGFHIIRVFSHYPEKQLAFEEIRDSLETEVRRNMEQSALVTFIVNIWNSDPGSYTFYEDSLENPTSSTLVLEWEGRPFLYSDLKARARLLDPPLPPEEWNRSLPMLLQREILARQARKKGLHKTKTFQTMRNWVENYILTEEYMKQMVDAKVTFTETELREYYDKNRERYFELEKSRALILEYRPTLSDSPVKRHREISDAKNLLLEGFRDCKTPEQFRETSEIFLEKNPGEVAFYDTGLIVPAKMGRIYDMAIAKIQTGEMSDPVEIKDGLTLIFCIEKPPFRYLSFKEAEKKVKRDILSEKCTLERRKLRENPGQKNPPQFKN